MFFLAPWVLACFDPWWPDLNLEVAANVSTQEMAATREMKIKEAASSAASERCFSIGSNPAQPRLSVVSLIDILQKLFVGRQSRAIDAQEVHRSKNHHNRERRDDPVSRIEA
jgi:hypothetical protein